MKTIEIGEATHPLAEYIPGVHAEPLVITDQGTPTAVILPLTNVDLEGIPLGTNWRFANRPARSLE
jgi:antitoxin (DNA-binding transcriptional repressor) of toxin-antitoxin stability system